MQPLGFGKHPLEDLLGQPVNEVHLESFQYRTRDGQTTVDVLEYGHRAPGHRRDASIRSDRAKGRRSRFAAASRGCRTSA